MRGNVSGLCVRAGLEALSYQPAPMQNRSTKLELTTSARMTQNECYAVGLFQMKNLIDMSKHLKQENAYGCGLYAIANIFQDESFITPTRLIESKNGNHTGQLNKWLLEYGQELYLEPFYFNSIGKKLPKWVCKMTPTGENVFSIPILIDVQYSKNSKTHFVAAEITTNGDLIVIDSLREEPYITTLTEFNRNNFRVFGVWYLRHYYEKGYFIRHNQPAA